MDYLLKRFLGVCVWVPLGIGVAFLAGFSNKNIEGNYVFSEMHIIINGDISDWSKAEWHDVSTADHLWLGQGIIAKGWQGPKDLSYSWAGAWDGKDRLFFVYKVNDDVVIDPSTQPNSFLNDCLELMLDFNNSGGPRFTGINGKREKLRGYEMHFLPLNKPLVFIDDTLSPMYPMSNPQNDLFKNTYAGEVAVKKFQGGYIVEIGFKLPDIPLGDGSILGVDTAVCDDDSKGRESLLVWHSGQTDYWITMDHYGKIILRKNDTK